MRGRIPASNAATAVRSRKPHDGSGSAVAVTTTSVSAFATTTRSVGSVSSEDRRSTVVRSATVTMRASVPSSPDVSPVIVTRSPGTMDRLRRCEARTHVMRGASAEAVARFVPGTTRKRPRSTETTTPGLASA